MSQININFPSFEKGKIFKNKKLIFVISQRRRKLGIKKYLNIKSYLWLAEKTKMKFKKIFIISRRNNRLIFKNKNLFLISKRKKCLINKELRTKKSFKH